jgi:hypothetical protein
MLADPDRRAFVMGLGSTAAWAQQGDRMRRGGVLTYLDADDSIHSLVS